MSDSGRLAFAALPETVDLLIVGGGVTGAGVFREAVRSGRRVLLVDAGDFAGGTSSGSSKLVHGGLRYLKEGQWRLTRESVQERRRLLEQAPGLVEPQPFVMPLYRGLRPGRWTMQLGLWLYDRMAGVRRSGYWNRERTLAEAPLLAQPDLMGAVHYEDARTDDTRLVLRLIFEAQAAGGLARNYTQATLCREQGRVVGAQLQDAVSGAVRTVSAGLVVWAVGAAATPESGAPLLRPLRGSHLLFPTHCLPVRQAISWLHPRDRRPVFAYPWEGAVLYGTTDLDHLPGAPLRLSRDEGDYLLEGLRHAFPQRSLCLGDAISSFSGVRPVVAGGAADPSAESRESALWSQPGLVGITGGKLTTFRVTARAVLAAAAEQDARWQPAGEPPVFDGGRPPEGQRRLYGRLGPEAAEGLLRMVSGANNAPVDGMPYTWAELRWAVRHEQVVTLADVMLRRTRLGLLLPRGGAVVLDRVLALMAEELGWSADRCAQARRDWQVQWQRDHDPEGGLA